MPTPRKPSKIKELEGNRGKFGRKSIPKDPQGIGRPSVPTHLNPEETKLYRHCMNSLPPEILTAADEAMLEVFAVAWARFRYANKQVGTIGLMVQSPTGPMRNPLLIVIEKNADIIHKVGSQLGLSPAARARLATIPTANEDPLALLLGDDMDPTAAWSTPSRERAN